MEAKDEEKRLEQQEKENELFKNWLDGEDAVRLQHHGPCPSHALSLSLSLSHAYTLSLLQCWCLPLSSKKVHDFPR